MPTVVALTKREILDERQKIIDRIRINAPKMSGIASYIKEEADYITEQGLIRKAAFIMAVDYIGNEAESIILNAAKAACYNTKEFNYEPFLSKLLTAISLNINDILYIDVDEKFQRTRFEIDFTKLGDVDEYALVVQAVRKSFPRTVSEPDAASRMWREKLYKTAREGRKLFRKWERKKKGGGGETETVSKDVTQLYAEKYRQTIAARVALIPIDKAPFWYLIEHGNYSVKFNNDRGGRPYPKFRATHFTNNTRKLLKKIFDQAFKRYLNIADKAVGNKLLEDYGVEETVESFKYLDDAIRDWTFENIDKETIQAATPGRTISSLKEADSIIQSYKTTANRIGVRKMGYYAPGKFGFLKLGK